MDLKNLVLFYLLGIIQVQGYIFRVKSEVSEKGVCLTDEQSSAIAPIQPLNSALKTSSENGWLASLNENIDEFECIPNAQCKNWNLVNTRFDSFKFDYKGDFNHMDLTRLWNYFPEFKTDGSEEFISPAIPINHHTKLFSGYSSLALSILAEEAEILFTSDEQWQGKPGIIVSLEATGEVWISACSKVFTRNSNCSKKFPGRSKYDFGGKWVNLKFTSENDDQYSVKINDDRPTNLYLRAIRSLSIDSIAIRYATFRSRSKPGLFKHFKYYALGLQKGPLTFKSHSIDLLKPRLIAFTFASETKNKYRVAVDGTAQKVKTTSIKKEQLYIDYLEIKNSSSVLPNLTISLTPNAEHFLLSVSAVSNGQRAIYIGGNLNACQMMSTGEVTSNIQNDKVAESLPDDISSEDICNKLNAPNCSEVEACSRDGCFCFSNHTRSPIDGKCTQRCDGNHHGPNCINKANGHCKVENFQVYAVLVSAVVAMGYGFTNTYIHTLMASPPIFYGDLHN